MGKKRKREKVGGKRRIDQIKEAQRSGEENMLAFESVTHREIDLPYFRRGYLPEIIDLRAHSYY